MHQGNEEEDHGVVECVLTTVIYFSGLYFIYYVIVYII